MKKLLVLLTVIGVLAAATSAASGSGAGSIVISEIFAAGGNSGAPYTNDYVELFNRGSSTVSLTGWNLQYSSSTGTTWASTALSGSIPAGGHYLVQLASSGTNGSALPAPDATGTSNLAVSGGKVQVVNARAGVETSSAGAPPRSTKAAGRRLRSPRRRRSFAAGRSATTPTTTRPTSPPTPRTRSTRLRRRRRAPRRAAAEAAAEGERRAAAPSASTSRR